MPSVVPTAPSPVPEVTIARTRRKAAPTVVLAHKGEQGPEVGTGADSLDLPDGWREALALTGAAGRPRSFRVRRADWPGCSDWARAR